MYDSRPIICRTFGLPSLHRDEKDEGVIDWCELNFTSVEPTLQFQADGIIDIDTLNTKLAGVNGLFVKESEFADERTAMDDIPGIDSDAAQA